MSVICIGPCCIPVAALFPFLAFLISPILNLLRKTPLAKYLPKPSAKNQEQETQRDEHIVHPTSLEHWEELKRTEALLIVDFAAVWCRPCKAIAPVFKDLAGKHKESATFVKVDIDDFPEAFDGTSIPTFQVFKAGKKVDSLSGAAEDRLRSLVESHCKKDS